MKIGFDNEKYLKMQSEHIRERINQFDNKLYLEFGGKLFDDYHASRVLPGFEPDSKLRLLKQLSDQAEIVIVISAKDIEKNIMMYLVAVNILAFICFGVDKQKAKTHQWRISENTLLGIAVCGGSLGAICGMRLFRHKTKHPKFTIGLPVILLLQAIAAVVAYTVF